jgi:hypothetical protein
MSNQYMEAFKNSLLIILLSVSLTGQGCKAPSAKPNVLQTDTAWREPTWGEAAEGLQCRLRPDRRIWRLGEKPSFKADMRNRGRRIFAFLPFHQLQLCRIQFDDKRYQWPSPFMIDSPVWPLAPGSQFNDIAITLHEQFKINLSAGRHIVRAVFSLEGIEVVSNPVGIEILPRG